MVRRPLLQGTVFFVLAFLVSDLISIKLGILLLPILCAIYSRLNERKMKITCILCICFYAISLLSYGVHELQMDPLAKYDGETLEMTGVVKSSQTKINDKGERHLVLKIEQNTFAHSTVLVNFYGDMEAGIYASDHVSFSGEIETPSVSRNPRCFDYSMYLRSVGIRHIMNASFICVDKQGKGIRHCIDVRKHVYLAKVADIAGEDTAAFMSGVLFGDKGLMSTETIDEFQKNGTAHILAVSGLHIGIIYGFLCKLWPWRKRESFLVFIGVFFLMYCMAANFSPSIVRASIMVMIHGYARLNNLKYDLNSAAFAVMLLMMINNPWSIYNSGFQMSFLAVLSMTLIMPYVKSIHDGFLTGSMAIQVGLMPYLMMTYNYLPLGALLVNIPIIYLTGIIVPIGLISMVLPAICPVLRILVQCIVNLNDVTCIDGITTINVVSSPIFLVAAFYLSMLAFLSEEGRMMIVRRNTRVVRFAAIVVIALSLVVSCISSTGFEKANLVFVDVGQGDCIHVRTQDNKNYLFDGGGNDTSNIGSRVLRPYLLKNGTRTVNGAIVTHLHTDHYKGIVELCRLGMIKHLYVYEGNRINEEAILSDTGLPKSQLHYVAAGDVLRLGKNCQAEILSPSRQNDSQYISMINDETNENDISLIIKVTIDGVSVLITGDIDSECEEQILDKSRQKVDADVIKIAHHGSKYSWSDRFMKGVTPEYAVIQVGKNNYGHPTSEVLNGLESMGIETWRNDEKGAIGFKISKGRVKGVVTMIDK